MTMKIRPFGIVATCLVAFTIAGALAVRTSAAKPQMTMESQAFQFTLPPFGGEVIDDHFSDGALRHFSITLTSAETGPGPTVTIATKFPTPVGCLQSNNCTGWATQFVLDAHPLAAREAVSVQFDGQYYQILANNPLSHATNMYHFITSTLLR
jgi:hypothetical protein